MKRYIKSLLMDLRYRKDPTENLYQRYRGFFNEHGYNFCFNRRIPRQYIPGKKNILIAVESPAVIEFNGWLKPEMEFVAEVSFGNFYELEDYYCCRTLYAAYDNFVRFHPEQQYKEKPKLVSLIYSNAKTLVGHKLRHEIAEQCNSSLDIYGSGTGRFLKEKSETLDHYKFQVVIENGKHPEYVSEKFFDCLKTKTIPIYCGGETALKKMGFDFDGVITFDTIEDLESRLEEVVSDDYYYSHLPAIEYNRSRLIEIRKESILQFYLDLVKIRYLGGLYTGQMYW